MKEFYKVYDILPKNLLEDLIENCKLQVKICKRNCNPSDRGPHDPFPPEEAEYFFNKKLLEMPCWNYVMSKAFKEIYKYYDKKVYLESCWINKIGYYSNEDIINKLYLHDTYNLYTENHYHIHPTDHVLSLVFYLQNPDPKYGTIISTKTGEYIMDGSVNSFSIFNSSLYHCAVIPPPEVTSKFPRYVLVMGFTDKIITKKNYKI
jgi:hypothetical protein